MAAKALIIRFSSFGDIVQCLAAATALRKQNPELQIHWAVRSDMADLLKLSPDIHRVWSFDRKDGFKGLVQFAKELNQEGFEFIYDAHNNLRSNILCQFVSAPNRLRRPKSRWKRFLEFKLGMPQFEQPFQGAKSFVTPLVDWGVRFPAGQKWLTVSDEAWQNAHSKFHLPKNYVTFAPSAAWEMKRWPIQHWKTLIQNYSEHPIVLLGGAKDDFIQELAGIHKDTVNLAGQTTLLESAAVISGTQKLIAADTGILHLGDGLGVPTLALIGPSAFGFPSHPNSKTLEVDLSCRPCSKDGRGKCSQKVYQRCLVEISPQRVLEELKA